MINLAGHYIRHKEEISHNLIIWTSTRRKIIIDHQQFTLIAALKLQTAVSSTSGHGIEDEDEIRSMMMNHGEWKKLLKLGRVRARRN